MQKGDATSQSMALRRIPSVCKAAVRASRILLAALLLAGYLAQDDPAASLMRGPRPERIAFVTNVSGNVSATWPGERHGVPLNLFAALAAGTVVKPGAGASVTVLCKSDTVLQLSRTVRVTGELCAQGAAVPPGTYARLDPRTGRLPSVPDPFDPDDRREKRDDYGRVPVVLSPRQTALMTNRPVIRWIEVPEAVEYRVKVLGPAGFEEVLDAKQLTCIPEAAFDRDRRTCSCSWPADRPGLTNKPHSLEVGVRLSLVEREPRAADEILWIRRLSAEKEAAVNLWVERLQDLHRKRRIDEFTRALVVAGVYAEEELLTAAVSEYHRALALQPSAEVEITLGDTYRRIDLHHFAARQYQRVLERNVASATNAAADLGLARVYHAWGEFQRAYSHAESARALYAELDLTGEAELAGRVAFEAARRFDRSDESTPHEESR